MIVTFNKESTLFFSLNYFHVSMKNLVEPILAPAKTEVVVDRSGSTLEFNIEFMALQRLTMQ